MALGLGLAALGLGLGCEEALAKQTKASEQAKKERAAQESHEQRERLGFDGRVVPTQATELRTPPNVIKLSNWTSSSGRAKIVDLAPDGAEVKQGQVVGKFEFRGEEARPRLQQNLDKARADQEKSRLELSQQLRELESTLERRLVESQQATLETRKEGLISERDLKIARMEEQQAQFEVEAARQEIVAHRRRMAVDGNFYETQVKRAESELTLLDQFAARFQIKAPNDGVMRHAFIPFMGRKVQKGDGVFAGLTFASIATDQRVSVDFYIPEKRRAEVKVGQKVRITSQATSEAVEGEVVRMEEFPQELGFLKEDEEMAGGREKVYVTRVELAQIPPGLKVGLDVKVSP
jgi:hypothetical protein